MIINEVVLVPTLICPVCGHRKTEAMPTMPANNAMIPESPHPVKTKLRRLLRVLFLWQRRLSTKTVAWGKG